MNIDKVRELVISRQIKWTTHGMERMQERDISRTDVINCIMNGDIIEDYPDDFPHPSCLILGFRGTNRPLHAVIACDDFFVYVITAYVPDLFKFNPDFKTRRL